MSASPHISTDHAPLVFSTPVLLADGSISRRDIPAEQGLTIYLEREPVVTLMTLGQSLEALVVGYLRNQGLVRALEDIASVQVDWGCGAAAVRLTHGPARAVSPPRWVTSGCGQGGSLEELEADLAQVRLPAGPLLDPAAINALLDCVRGQDRIYRQAGAVHGCGLLAQGTLLYYVEDVGRHNALDSIAGLLWLEGCRPVEPLLYTTGRLTAEMVIKAGLMQVPVVVSRSGVTQLGYDIGKRLGMTLIGRARTDNFLCFTGWSRLRSPASPPSKHSPHNPQGE